MHLHHGIDQLGRTAGVADAPARHGERLGKAVQKDRALRHARQRGDAGVFAVEGEFRIDLVAQHQQVLLPRKRGDFCQLVLGTGAARRIARQVEHQNLGPGLPRLFQGFGGEGKVVLGVSGHRQCLAMRQADAGMVGHVTGLVIHHLVPRIEKRAEGQVEGLRNADRHDHLVFGTVVHAEGLGHITGDLLAQLGRAEIRGVKGAPLFETVDGGFADVPGRGEIGFADAERNDLLAFHFGHEFKKVANAALGERGHVARHPLGRIGFHDDDPG